MLQPIVPRILTSEVFGAHHDTRQSRGMGCGLFIARGNLVSVRYHDPAAVVSLLNCHPRLHLITGRVKVPLQNQRAGPCLAYPICATEAHYHLHDARR